MAGQPAGLAHEESRVGEVLLQAAPAATAHRRRRAASLARLTPDLLDAQQQEGDDAGERHHGQAAAVPQAAGQGGKGTAVWRFGCWLRVMGWCVV